MKTKQIEEITSFRPLTKSQRKRLWLLAHFTHILTCVLTVGCVGLVISMWARWSIPKNTAYSIVGIAAVLGAIAFALTRRERRAKKILKLEDMAIVCSLTERANPLPHDGRRYFKTCVTTPLTMSDARREAVKDTNTLVSIILPLRRGLATEIYIRHGGNGPVQMNLKLETKMRFETVEAFWGQTDLKTRVRLVDQTGSSLEMDIVTALRRIYDNRFRIESIETIDDLFQITESQLEDAMQTVEKLRASFVQCETDRNTLVSAIVDAITGLADYERLFRSWAPVKAIGTALVRTTLAVPPQNVDERTRVTVAAAAFERK